MTRSPRELAALATARQFGIARAFELHGIVLDEVARYGDDRPGPIRYSPAIPTDAARSDLQKTHPPGPVSPLAHFVGPDDTATRDAAEKLAAEEGIHLDHAIEIVKHAKKHGIDHREAISQLWPKSRAFLERQQKESETVSTDALTREQMDSALSYQASRPGTSWGDAMRFARGNRPSAAPSRNAATEAPVRQTRYTEEELRDRLRSKGGPVTRAEMGVAHYYQARHRGLNFAGAMDIVRGITPEPDERYGEDDQGTGQGRRYTGATAGAQASGFFNNQHSARLAERERIEELKGRCYDMAERRGLPVGMVLQGAGDVEAGRAVSLESAVEAIMARERNRNEFGDNYSPSVSLTNLRPTGSSR